MDSSESISFSMDTTTDSIDVRDHFSSASSKNHSSRQSPRKQQQQQQQPRQQLPRRMLLRETNNEIHDDDETTSSKLPPDKEDFIVVDETPPPSAASSTTSSIGSNTSATSSTTASIAPSVATADFFSSSSQLDMDSTQDTIKRQTATRTTRTPTPHRKKSVLFDMVTVYHFNRSQGFTSIPSQGGSTLGMKRKHFLRRRLSVDLYEEVRRRSRREILLRIRIEKKKQEERERLRQQQQLNERLKGESNSSSASNTNTSDSDDNNGHATNLRGGSTRDNDDDDIDVNVVEADEEDSYSGYSDISDSELEIDSYIFLQPTNVKLRRSMLRACGVGRIDPGEKKECNKIRTSRDRSGCQCVGQCIPKFCECSRLGVKCHVDRASFPCGCVAEGCKNPEGRTEFDIARVRSHFAEKVIGSSACLWSTTSGKLDDFSSTEEHPGDTTLTGDTQVSEDVC